MGGAARLAAWAVAALSAALAQELVVSTVLQEPWVRRDAVSGAMSGILPELVAGFPRLPAWRGVFGDAALRWTVNDGYGAVVNGSWSGTIGDVYGGVANVSVAVLSITQLRLGAVQFTTPFQATGNAWAVKASRGGDEVRLWSFLTPFSVQLWILVVFVMVRAQRSEPATRPQHTRVAAPRLNSPTRGLARESPSCPAVRSWPPALARVSASFSNAFPSRRWPPVRPACARATSCVRPGARCAWATARSVSLPHRLPAQSFAAAPRRALAHSPRMIATKRLQKELLAIAKDPPPFIRVRCRAREAPTRPRAEQRWSSTPRSQAKPLETDILSWHYVIEGPPGSPYAGGHYHGCIKFPSEYPLKPPSVMMLTPSGRFAPGQRLCLVSCARHRRDRHRPPTCVAAHRAPRVRIAHASHSHRSP